jgi:hypothetical protein
MNLADANAIARRAEATRRMIRQRGTTPTGDRIWTADEDDICRQHGDDYEALQAKLPHRSYSALRKRCQALGLRPNRQIMTANEVSRLRRLYPTASHQELQAAFPGRSIQRIRRTCSYFSITRNRQPLKETGYAIINEIRRRCFELNYSMVDLDEIAGTGNYFSKANWHTQGLNAKAVYRAVKALDGELAVRWNDEEPSAPCAGSSRRVSRTSLASEGTPTLRVLPSPLQSQRAHAASFNGNLLGC